MTPIPISADEMFDVTAICPVCGGVEVVELALASRLTSTLAGTGLGLHTKQTAAAHTCGGAS
jgi:hypothetical protein